MTEQAPGTETDPQVDPKPAGETPQGWDAVLGEMPEDTRKLYDEHTGGLKSALDSEREERKKLAKQVKDMTSKLSTFEEAEGKRKKADMTELEKAQNDLNDLRAQYDKMVADHDSLRLRQTFYDAVGAEKLEFASPQARQDAYELVDLADVIDAGEIDAKKVTKALKALQEMRPYLFGKTVAPDTDAAKRGAGTVEATDDEVKEFAAIYGLNPEHVDRTLLANVRR